jgi:hypothetical protein
MTSIVWKGVMCNTRAHSDKQVPMTAVYAGEGVIKENYKHLIN